MTKDLEVREDGTMTQARNTRWAKQFCLYATLLAVAAIGLTGCSTAPPEEDQATFRADARSAVRYFETRVPGLPAQIRNSAGYIIFPDVAQWGIIFGGGKTGRGMVCEPDGTQVGWASVNTGSIGLQAGVQGFKMLIVLQNDAKMQEFQANKWGGGASAVAVAAEAGGSGTAAFENGVAVYQGANAGLMAGVNIGLDYVRYEPLD
jgi:lipid-binding SYLF domain-containing protein